jgi:hypothetical protein
MTYAQLITPNPDIACTPGYCLQYVRQTFGLPARYNSATEAWDASTSQHTGRDFPPGVWVPVWYGLDREPLGHVALLAPDGSAYSTSDNSSTPHHHPDLADLEAYYAGWGWPLTYRGWTEDVAGYPVIASGGIAAMGTITQEELVPNANDKVFKDVDGNDASLQDYLLSLDAQVKALKSAVAAVPAGVLFENRVDGRNLIDWQKQLRADVLGIQPGSIDVPAIAKALAEQLPKADAEALVDALAARLGAK